MPVIQPHGRDRRRRDLWGRTRRFLYGAGLLIGCLFKLTTGAHANSPPVELSYTSNGGDQTLIGTVLDFYNDGEKLFIGLINTRAQEGTCVPHLYVLSNPNPADVAQIESALNSGKEMALTLSKGEHDRCEGEAVLSSVNYVASLSASHDRDFNGLPDGIDAKIYRQWGAGPIASYAEAQLKMLKIASDRDENPIIRRNEWTKYLRGWAFMAAVMGAAEARSMRKQLEHLHVTTTSDRT